MQATVQVTAEAARALQGPPSAAQRANPLLDFLVQHNLALAPMHKGAADPELRSFYVMELPDSVNPDLLLDRLRSMPGVEAAYVKPPDELP